jgi:hypothetical protein
MNMLKNTTQMRKAVKRLGKLLYNRQQVEENYLFIVLFIYLLTLKLDY